MRRSLLWGALAGAAYAVMATRPARIRISVPAEGSPEDLMHLVEQVEREPELIPFVEAVKVRSRDEDSVQYRVEVSVGGIPGWAEFHKRICPEEGHAEWVTCEATLHFDQRGRIFCEEKEGKRFLSLVTDTRFHLPVVGQILAHLSTPVLTYAFGEWLFRLNRAVSANGSTESGGIGALAVDPVVA